MNAIIIYKGKYGATRQYAEWLGEELKIPVLKSDEIHAEQIRNYDFIILGSSVYIGKLELSGWIKQNNHLLRNKKLFVFIVCATPPDEIEKLRDIEVKNIPGNLKSVSTVFFLHGRMLLQKLSWKDRMLLRLGAHFVKNPEEKKHMLQDFDDVRKDNLQNLIEACREILQPQNVQ